MVETFNIGLQTIGIAADPFTQVNNMSFYYSTLQYNDYVGAYISPIWRRYSGLQEPEYRVHVQGKLFIKYS